jgi:hypothetical protein
MGKMIEAYGETEAAMTPETVMAPKAVMPEPVMTSKSSVPVPEGVAAERAAMGKADRDRRGNGRSYALKTSSRE